MPDGAAWGIDRGYWDALGQWQVPPDSTVDSILRAMGATDDGPPGLGDDNPVWVVREGSRVRLDGVWRLLTEDGGDEEVDGRLPRDLPSGYHHLHRDGRDVRLIVSPGRCHLPEGLRQWGWAAQLYAARSRNSWGMGDLGDLERLGEWAAGHGAGFVLVNPLHDSIPGPTQQASPYYGSSRVFRNPLYIDIRAVDGFDASDADLARLVKEAHRLNHAPLIDRDAVYSLKLEALERIWALRRERFEVSHASYVADQGAALYEHATFNALSEVHGKPWTAWPADLRRPDGAKVSEFQRAFSARIDFHQWVQWEADRQMARAGRAIGVVNDLAIGVDPAGSDAWRWQDVHCLAARVGAPPDEFNTKGQDWGLPPYDPWKLRLARFQPFIETVRAGLRHAQGLRIDHVMGLFRLFWIPEDATPAQGTYVRYPFEELLDILALESVRAGAYVIGEDLGTVEDAARSQLHERQVLSYKLLWFEPQPPAEFPVQSMAAVTTHDLPTVAGLFTGTDVRIQQELGLEPNEDAERHVLDRVRRWTGLADDASVDEAVVATHRLLADAPSTLVSATLEDALGVTERPNYPGTVDERPNWSIPLPLLLDELFQHPGPAAVAAAIDHRTQEADAGEA